jgi:subfamily B ATP-binding cassette protein HlyB/CyaB
MPRNRVIALAKLTGAHDFIGQMPHGYDTMIEERGANLSGGQRQRIAIARALANNPRILIFDEATSALDYESEQIIHRNMGEIVRGRTVIIIAHRLAAVRSCHRIIGLTAGRIVEQGTHEELVHREKGLYANLWAIQAGETVG